MAAVFPENWQTEMQQRKCRFCDRTFAKTEHLSRHQRSHTGEKPYKCPRCPKRFARSDVLTRHQKAHVLPIHQETRSVSENGDESDASSNRGPVEPQSTIRVHESQVALPSTQADRIAPEPNNSPLPHVQPQQPAHGDAVHSSLSQQEENWFDSGLATLLRAGALSPKTGTLNPQLNRNQSWSLEQASAVESMDITVANGGLQSPADTRYQSMQDFESGPSYDSGIPQTTHDSNRIQFNHHVSRSDQVTPNGVYDMTDDMQSWSNQFVSGIGVQADDFTMFESRAISSPDIFGPDRAANESRPQRKGFRNRSESGLVPIERFANVEQCWWNRSGHGFRVMHTLWQDLIFQNEDNLFDNPGSSAKTPTAKQRDGSRRGINQDVRDGLRMVFGTTCATTPPNSGQRPEHNQSSGSAMDGVDQEFFPSVEDLDTGLDRYFQHYHPLMPFVHIPTFNPKSANVSLLFLMCLIGLTIIHTNGLPLFVKRGLAAVLKILDEQMVLYRPGSQRKNKDSSTIMASCVLAMALSEIVGEKSNMSITHRLYLHLLTQAQEQQMFATVKGQPQATLDLAFEKVLDVDSRWKAWSRVECTKRLILCVLLVDSWNSTIQYTCPLIRTDNLRISMPCDTALFEADSSTKWLALLRKGHQLHTPALELSTRSCNLPKFTTPMENLGMLGTMCAIRLRISEDYHRLLSSQSRSTTSLPAPWQVFANDPQAKITQTFVLEVMDCYGHNLSKMNPNLILVWHNMCMMLTSDSRLFELGAGSAGAAAAHDALEDISAWSVTTAARRAIIHAAQTYKLMSNRRPLDGDPFHASHGLFLSALTLGLYVFMVPPENEDDDENAVPYELLDDVNWGAVGSKGMSYDDGYVDDPAVQFIRKGGPISISGIVHLSGYESARRILQDFSSLLEDVEKWKIGHYTKVLRIMSGSFIDRTTG